MPCRLRALGLLAVALILHICSTHVGALVRPPLNTGRRLILYNQKGGISDVDNSSNSNEDSGNDMNNDENSQSNNMWFRLSQDTRDDIKSTAVSFGIALLVRVFLVEPRYIPSLSMFPTFDIGDQLLVDKISHVQRGYLRRDVVVFNPPEAYTDLTGNTEALIKRIVAVAGDTIEVKGNRVYVNGVAQEEAYTNESPDYALEPVTVPTGCVLVLGDNRNHSFDSHVWGFLPEKNIIGRAVLKYWPPSRFGNVEGSV